MVSVGSFRAVLQNVKGKVKTMVLELTESTAGHHGVLSCRNNQLTLVYFQDNKTQKLQEFADVKILQRVICFASVTGLIMPASPIDSRCEAVGDCCMCSLHCYLAVVAGSRF